MAVTSIFRGNNISGGGSGPGQTALGPPDAVFLPDQRSGDGKVAVSFTPA